MLGGGRFRYRRRSSSGWGLEPFLGPLGLLLRVQQGEEDIRIHSHLSDSYVNNLTWFSHYNVRVVDGNTCLSLHNNQIMIHAVDSCWSHAKELVLAHQLQGLKKT